MEIGRGEVRKERSDFPAHISREPISARALSTGKELGGWLSFLTGKPSFFIYKKCKEKRMKTRIAIFIVVTILLIMFYSNTVVG